MTYYSMSIPYWPKFVAHSTSRLKNETKRASKLMARMYTAIEKAYPVSFDAKKRDHEISVSLARILFLLFGDDTQMWATDCFQDFIKDHTARDGSDIGRRLSDLFEHASTPRWEAPERGCPMNCRSLLR